MEKAAKIDLFFSVFSVVQSLLFLITASRRASR